MAICSSGRYCRSVIVGACVCKGLGLGDDCQGGAGASRRVVHEGHVWGFVGCEDVAAACACAAERGNRLEFRSLSGLGDAALCDADPEGWRRSRQDLVGAGAVCEEGEGVAEVAEAQVRQGKVVRCVRFTGASDDREGGALAGGKEFAEGVTGAGEVGCGEGVAAEARVNYADVVEEEGTNGGADAGRGLCMDRFHDAEGF